MHNLAIALQSNGHKISGSDDEIFEPSKSRLIKYGLLPEKVGWNPEILSNSIDVVILGMHAKADNPELIKAQELGLTIYSYPEFLYFHSKDKKRVVIGGSHGKTTITGMVMHVLKKYNHKFDYLVGSKLEDFDVMVQLSEDAPVMIFEGDEYLTSPIDRRPKFHWYKAHIALLSGIAWDHINVFPTFENYIDQFRIFIDLIEKDGTLIYNTDDEVLKELIEEKPINLTLEPYTLPEYETVDGITSIKLGGEKYQLKVFGEHNLLNINGARLVCNSLGITNSDFYKAMESFKGAANRLELLAKKDKNWFYKDFAHAPSKVKATVKAVREQFPEYKLIVCFELHTFSSLSEHFLKQYEGSLSLADNACVYFNPHALALKRLPDLNTDIIMKAFDFEKLAIFADAKEMVGWLEKQKGGQNVYLCMSSGDFDGTDLAEISEKLV